jgi:hypothetical protein
VPEADAEDAANAGDPAEAASEPAAAAAPEAALATDRGADPAANAAANAAANPAADPAADPKAGPNADPNADPKADPKAGSKADPKAGSKADPKAGPDADPKAASKADPAAEPKAAPGAAPSTAVEAVPAPPMSALTGVKLSNLDQALRQVTASVAAPPAPAPAQPIAAPVLAPPGPVGAPAAGAPAAGAPAAGAPAAGAPAAGAPAAGTPAAAGPRTAPAPVAPSPAPAPHALSHQAPAAAPAPAPDAISAGPRPRVEPAGPADPAHAEAAASTTRGRLDARLTRSVATTTRDLGAATLDAPVAPHAAPPSLPPAPAPPPIAAPPIPEAPWRQLDPAVQGRLDQAVAPALERRVAALTARTEADTAQTQAQLAQLDGAHRAEVAAATARAQEQTAALRSAGTAQIDGVRGQWQARSTQLRDQTVAQVTAEHAAAQTEIQATVHDGEVRSDAILTEAERNAAARRAAAEASAQATLAAAAARADGARARGASVATARSVARQELVDEGGGGGAADGEAEARQILEDAQAQVDAEIARAQREIEQLIANAGALSEEQIEHRLLLIAARISRLQASLEQKVDEALGDRFPELEAAYLGQIDFLIDDIRSNMFSVADALLAGNAELAATQFETARVLIDARAERLNMTLEDAAVLSTFDDVHTALDAFNISMTSTIDGRDWTDAQRQAALAQAIRMENTFRAIDQDGMFEEAGLTEPGAAFSAIMNGGQGITLQLTAAPVHAYTEEQRQQMLANDTANRYGGDINNVPTTWEQQGAETINSGMIEFYSLSSRSEGLADGLQFHFGHEFGHAFNGTMVNADNALDGDRTDVANSPYADLGSETILDASGVAVAGADVERFVLDRATIREVTAAAQESAGDAWATMTQAERDAAILAEAQARSVEQGLQMSADSLRQTPYQQNPYNSTGEWFADLYVNWANGTLADGPAGDAVDAWMDEHAEDWLRMRLEADGLLEPEEDPPASSSNTPS